MCRFALIGLTLMIHIGPARALELPQESDKAVPCRPTISCTADLANPGTTELESGFLFNSQGGAGYQSSFPFLTKFTFAPWSQLQIGSNGYTVLHGETPGQYFDDVTVGEKVHVLDQTATLPSISFSTTANLPTAQNQNGYVRAYDALFAFYMSRDFGAIHADLNAGFNLLRIGNSPLTQKFISLALSYGLSARWSIEGESYYFTNASPVSSRDAGFRSALTYSLHPCLIFDLGGDTGFISTTRVYSVFMGFTLVPATMWRPAK